MTGTRLKLLLDEHIWPGLTDVFEPQGYDLKHVVRVGLQSASDEAVLSFAARDGRVVLTNNYRDFVLLVANWYAAGRAHAGVILTQQLTRSELIRQVQQLFESVSAEDMHNTCRWLHEFTSV